MKNEKKIKAAIQRAAALKAEIDALKSKFEVERNFLMQNLEVGMTVFAGTDKALLFESERTSIDRAALEKMIGKNGLAKVTKHKKTNTLKIN